MALDLTWSRRTDDSVAPALQAAKERLQRSQLEVSSGLVSHANESSVLSGCRVQDKLGHALQARPKPEELVKEGILKGQYYLLYTGLHLNR